MGPPMPWQNFEARARWSMEATAREPHDSAALPGWDTRSTIQLPPIHLSIRSTVHPPSWPGGRVNLPPTCTMAPDCSRTRAMKALRGSHETAQGVDRNPTTRREGCVATGMIGYHIQRWEIWAKGKAEGSFTLARLLQAPLPPYGVLLRYSVMLHTEYSQCPSSTCPTGTIGDTPLRRGGEPFLIIHKSFYAEAMGQTSVHPLRLVLPSWALI